MRKTIIALIIVLPLVFVLVIFSSLNLISLRVDVSANGIVIRSNMDDEDEQILMDMASYDVMQAPIKISAEVLPANATNRDYRLRSEDGGIVSVADDGTLVPKKEGTTTIVATSNDKGFTDSLPVTVTSSKPYSFEFKMFPQDGGVEDDFLTPQDGGYRAKTQQTGKYGFSFAIEPAGFENYDIVAKNGSFVVVDKGANTLFFPFSGNHRILLTVPDAVGGTLEKELSITIRKPNSDSGIIVNGEASGFITLSKGVRSATVFVESKAKPMFESAIAGLKAETVSLGDDRYKIELSMDSSFDAALEEHGFNGSIHAGDKQISVEFTYKEFEFDVRSSRKIEQVGENLYKAAVLANNSNTFHAVSNADAAGVEYVWTIEGVDESVLSTGNNGLSCIITPVDKGRFTLKVSAMLDGSELASKSFELEAYDYIKLISLASTWQLDLAQSLTIPGKKYNEQNEVEEYIFPLTVIPLKQVIGENLPQPTNSDEDINYTFSKDGIAEVLHEDGKLYVKATGEGNVDLTAEWIGKELFGIEVKVSINLNFVKDAVLVNNAPELRTAMENSQKTVLGADIMLGTDKQGNKYDIATLKSMLGRTKSTYNIEWYKYAQYGTNTSQVRESDAMISFAQEITADLYGNGHQICAEYFTNAREQDGQEGQEKPLIDIYDKPLYFVNGDDVASVSGQDNCAFLIRTDNITVYGVSLLGCKDESIWASSQGGEPTQSELTKLNHVGTTLDINASCKIISCRIRNGRNTVRVYGGNRNGDKYFVDSLSESTDVESQRIKVTIDGCVISAGREFLVKVGANRALRASNSLGAEPSLTDANGSPYKSQGGDHSNKYEGLLNDEYFYSHYVMTDLTISDSILETSGLFTIGVESNFAGPYLYEGTNAADDNVAYYNYTKTWTHSGGTSFASVLRLKGDVRLYDWKDLSLVDSSSLIESTAAVLRDWMKLDINALLQFVLSKESETNGAYDNLLLPKDGTYFVHGGIACYGGGKNYSQVDISGLNDSLKDGLAHVNINLSILSRSSDTNLQNQGNLLPRAAGTNDFNFYMYTNESPNSYEAQLHKDMSNLKPKPRFE